MCVRPKIAPLISVQILAVKWPLSAENLMTGIQQHNSSQKDKIWDKFCLRFDLPK
jgi:hypothetical protein